MAVAVQSEKLRELVDENAEVEQIATGFTFTEGPIWMADGSLHFSDMPGDKRRRWHPDEGVTVLRDPSNKCNGMTLDNDGNLIVCEHVTSSRRPRIARRDGRETLASHWGEQGAEQPERRDRRVRRLDHLHRPDLRPHARVRRSSASRISTSRASTACPAGGGDLSCSSTTSRSRTGSASRPTSRCSTSTTPIARTSASSTSAPTTRSRTAACSPRGSAPATWRTASSSTG